MVIGIIGASISGLIAGKRLALAGHDVTVIEKDRSLGGQLATVKLDDLTLDYGISHFTANTNTFQEFIDELIDHEIIHEWADEFHLHDGKELLDENPNLSPQPRYAGKAGLQSVAGYLSRWVDLKSKEKAGGLTHIGSDRTRKRSWMINMTDISVFECDAVIIATPAVEAYGILQTAQDETPARRIIRHIDEVQYEGAISLAVTYDHEMPEWKGIDCEFSSIRWICNESSKQESAEQAGLVIRSSGDFYRRHAQSDDETVKDLLLEEASKIIDSWVLQPKSTYMHRWKYFETKNPINEYFMELEMEEAPLALIGDYLGGTSPENAFISGYSLAEYWIKKYSEVNV
jgi:predicted NAD/FAD-dependent oxidoreductase